MSIIDIQNLSFSYPDRKLDAVKDVSLSVDKGEYIAILGTNGSGKSTLARLICGYLSPTSGSIVMEENLRVGLVFQSPGDQIVANIVEADTSFGPRNLKCSKEEIKRRTIGSLEAVGLQKKIMDKTRSLSQGQKQKLGVAGIIALHPDLLVLDEATSMIDPESRSQLLSLLDAWHGQGQTILHITHSLDEAHRAQRVVAMNEGQLIFDGSREEFRANNTIEGQLFGQPLSPRSFVACPSKRWIPSEDFTNDIPAGFQNDAALIFHNITFSYGQDEFSAEVERDASGPFLFDNFSLAVEAGRLTALMGPSGCGKSTLMEIAAGLLEKQNGAVYSNSRPLLALQDSDHGLFEEFVADDIAFGPRNQGISGKNLVGKVQFAMEQVGLSFEKFGERQTMSLSGGEKRKVSLAGIIAMEGQVLLFDEPTAGLDAKSRRMIMEMLLSLVRAGKTVLFTTHREDEALLAHRIVRLSPTVPVSIKEIVMDKELLSKSVPQESFEEIGMLHKQETLGGVGLLKFLSNFGGSFSAGNKNPSFIQRLPALAKYLVFFVLFIFSFVTLDLVPAAIGVACTIVYALLARYPLKGGFLAILKLLPWLLFFFLIQIFFLPSPADDPVFWSFGILVITQSKVMAGVLLLLHLVAAFVSLSVFVYSISEQEILDGLESLLYPLGKCGVPVRHVTLVAGIVFRFVPLLAQEAALIVKIQLIRGGLGEASGLIARIRILLPLLIPLTIRTLTQASILADALTSRYYS
ncbi:MAG: ATP-binding cassette domain-containing protein [Spirochaetaceae bacterium]|nr:ATP-binding cassette domain-containing protein [Spirochaetaceae bacterium]